MRIRRSSHQQSGYILPATILLGLATAVLSVVLLQITATASQTLNNYSYRAMAKEAAVAGTTYVDGCVASSVISWTTLTPHTDCSGNTTGGSDYIGQGDGWRSTFSVDAPTVNDGKVTAVSTGTVQLLYGTTVVQTYKSTSKITLPSTITTLPVATGQVITDIKNDKADCAIANGKLYCWGDNSLGQLGRGDANNTSSARATPIAVGGALAGKTVTAVSVGTDNVCAIADGTPYCWGSNGTWQNGNNSLSPVYTPTAGAPRTSSGPLAGLPTVDIGVSSFNQPASFIWPFAAAFPHACALSANGTVSCWGDGGFRQNTGGYNQSCSWVFVWVCGQTAYYSYPTNPLPTLTVGYQAPVTYPYPPERDNPVTTKATNIIAASHAGCALSNGQVTCWGVPAPLPVGCWIPPLGQFSPIYENVYPWNGCTYLYSNGYNASTLSGSALSGKFVDPNSWNGSANEGCWMANTDLVCFGTTPAFGGLWSGVVSGQDATQTTTFTGWGAPWTLLSNADVTSADNGDDAASWGTQGLFCIINKGVPACAGGWLNSRMGSNNLGAGKTFFPLDATAGLAGNAATKIAVGAGTLANQNHGCVVANGRLYCWGDGSNGVLADGNINSHIVAYPTLSANSIIGATNGTYAASGPIAEGDGFGCGLVNGRIYCWGDNSYGALGFGNNDDSLVPRLVPWSDGSSIDSTITKVSAGAHHACAIAAGKLYCWGDNSYGQLGIGITGGTRNSPQLVSGFSSMRVTEVSAGTNSTCAIANGHAYCWGSNSSGQLGSNSYTNYNAPHAVNLSSSIAVTKITVGDSFACAVGNAEAYCWGDNSSYQLADGTQIDRPNPVHITSGTAGSPKFGPNADGDDLLPMVSDISAGSNFTCAIINGTVSCWGANANGRTGRGTTSGYTTSPTKLYGTPGGYYATSITTGTSHACAVLNGGNSLTNGNLYCWGNNGTDGKVGNGSTSDVSTATVLSTGGRSTINVSAGANSTCSVSNGDILCWGNNSSGQLGNGGTTAKPTPTITSSYVQLGSYSKGIVY